MLTVSPGSAGPHEHSLPAPHWENWDLFIYLFVYCALDRIYSRQWSVSQSLLVLCFCFCLALLLSVHLSVCSVLCAFFWLITAPHRWGSSTFQVQLFGVWSLQAKATLAVATVNDRIRVKITNWWITGTADVSRGDLMVKKDGINNGMFVSKQFPHVSVLGN